MFSKLPLDCQDEVWKSYYTNHVVSQLSSLPQKIYLKPHLQDAHAYKILQDPLVEIPSWRLEQLDLWMKLHGPCG